MQSGTERVQALGDILRSALRCHSNKTSTPTVNPPNGAQPGSTPYHSPKLHPGPCSNVGMRPRRDTQMRMTTIHFRRLWLTPNVISDFHWDNGIREKKTTQTINEQCLTKTGMPQWPASNMNSHIHVVMGKTTLMHSWVPASFSMSIYIFGHPDFNLTQYSPNQR